MASIWDGHLDQAPQTLARPYISSSNPSNFSFESFRAPVENQHVNVIEQTSPLDSFLQQKRPGDSLVQSSAERESFTELSPRVQLHDPVDTSSVSSGDVQSLYDRPAVVHTPPKPRLQSHLTTYSKSLSSQFTPNSSVHVFYVPESQVSPSTREHSLLSEAAFTTGPEIIDLTEDTEEELAISEMLPIDPGSCRQHNLPRSSSPPIGKNRSLFTPPIPKSRGRTIMEHVAVPSFPRGLTKADYKPLSNVPKAPISHVFEHPSLADALCSAFTQNCAPSTVFISSDRSKGKEREREDVASSTPAHKKHKSRASITFGAGLDTTPSTLLDATYAHAIVPLEGVDIEPPLTRIDLATNTRFEFAHAWRKRTSTLQEAELEWITRFKVIGRACSMAGPSRASLSPQLSTAGYFVNGGLQEWELVAPESSPRNKSGSKGTRTTKSPDPANAKKRASTFDVKVDPPADPPNVHPNAIYDPELSNSTTVQEGEDAGAIVDIDVDMYFNGLSDSPKPVVPPQHHVAPIHTFGVHLLQFAEQAQPNSHASGFPPLSIDTMLAQKDGEEYFFGMPPSPTAAEMEPPPPLLTPAPPSPFQVDHFVSQEGHLFVQSGSPTLTPPWSLSESGDLPQNDDSRVLLSSPSNGVFPSALDTIDPSLLGGQQPPVPQPKVAPPKRRSNLPEPIIYVRRPIHSSSLPVVPGKRPVQIKFRSQELPPTTGAEESDDERISVTGAGPKVPDGSILSSRVRNNVERSASVAGEDNITSSSLPKRCSLPSRKSISRVESESDSSFAPSRVSQSLSISVLPKTNKPKPKLKLKPKSSRTGRNQEVITEGTFCHQCRNTNVRPKMQCSNKVQGYVCGKRFCNRCILHRYPDITFDQFSAGFMCPACTNTCNCSHCARKRGEEYISMRGGGFAGSRIQTKVTLIRDEPKPMHSRRSLLNGNKVDASTTPESSSSTAPPAMFWAHVYGLEGERVGSAIINPEYAASLSKAGLRSAQPVCVPAPPPPQAHKQKQKKADQPRIFIGRPQRSWKIRATRDLEPSSDCVAACAQNDPNADVDGLGNGHGNAHGKGKDKAIDGRPLRVFIGNPTVLREPYARMPCTPAQTSSRVSSPGPDSDGTLTSLSELEADYWPQPGVGESCSWAPPLSPPCLHGGTVLPGSVVLPAALDIQRSVSMAMSEEELARAISAALAALV
ncbi:hypothetical protein PAXRUDRAFT_833041 [Paxillus rubicundulus Ve08.2h10]|uniref:Zinc-finger domain-containing protein n=1 Tax=Paxillus rubicundulus Ve08.2h10 TaxID=930991 RepID=A0A0D0DAY0_9AGAM|nr:hypothetical protein PAXRUDRAFT_833041 [Paxillus rubicundulus Ve08.2h10]